MKHANTLWVVAASLTALTAALAVRTGAEARELLAAVVPPERVELAATAAPAPWTLAAAAETEARIQVGEERASEFAAPVEPMLAQVRLRGELFGVRGRGAEVAVTVTPNWRRREPGFRSVEALELDDELAAPDSFSFCGRSSSRSRDDLQLRGGAHTPIACRPDGKFEHDLTAWLASRRRLPESFLVSVSHPNFASVTLTVPFTEGGRPVTRSRLAKDETVWLDLSFELEPHCILRGTAWLYDTTGPVQLEAWRLAGDTPAGMVSQFQVESADQLYELPVPLDGRFAVVAFAEGYVPQTRVVFTWDSLDLVLAPIVLNHGERLSGHVDLSRHTLGSGAILTLSRMNPVLRGDLIGNNGFVWFGNAFHPESQQVQVDGSGQFAFEGLTPGTWELRVGIARAECTEMDPVLYVSVPNEGVVLDAPLTHIALEIEQGRHPVDRRPFRVLNHSGSKAMVTDRFGRADLWLFRGEPYRVAVSQERGDDWVYGKLAPWYSVEFTERISMTGWARH